MAGSGEDLAAVPCDAEWTNLPARPFYLPLMQQLVTYLASKVYPPRNVDVGKPLVAFLPSADAGKKTILIFSDMQEELDKVTVRNFPIDLKNIRVIAVNVVKLKIDNVDPRLYLGRL